MSHASPSPPADGIVSTLLSFRFADPAMERDWQLARLGISRRVNSVAAGVCALLSLGFFVADLVWLHSPVGVQVGRGATVLIAAFGVRWYRRARQVAVADRVTMTWVLGAVALVWALMWAALSPTDFRYYWLPGAVLTMGGAFVLFELPFRYRPVLAVVNGIGACWAALHLSVDAQTATFAVIHLLGAMGIGWLSAWQVELARRQAFVQRCHAEREHARASAEQARADGLLRNILPGCIADLLLSQPGTIAKRHEDITVLFADIVGFTPMSAALSAEEVVTRLDDIFTRFDQLCDQHGVEKIKTIGDAYMAAGGVPTARDDHAQAVAAVALDMISAVDAVNARLGTTLQLRIGLHTGPLVAGVIGERKFIYDLWGDTVNTASRMESHGVPGRVHVSEETATRLRSAFQVTPRGHIEVKGKGAMPTYFVDPKHEHAASSGAA